MDSIYFDHAATTPLDPEVLEEMLPYLGAQYGNASSTHHMGQSAKVALEDARELVASLIGAEPSETVFTSGGTESDNAAIRGLFETADGRDEILTSPVEHHAVLHTVESLKRHGGKPVWLNPGSSGRVSPDQVERAINEKTALVTLMHVNNETGTINPVREIAEVCREKGVPFHTDAVQSIGKIPVHMKELGVDILSISAHKFYGPKGVGVMVVRNGAPWIPWQHGGSQERNRRGGTSNIPGIAGLAKALKLAVTETESRYDHAMNLRSHLLRELDRLFGGRYRINGPEKGGVPHIINLGFYPPPGKRLDGEMLLLNLDIEGICVSNGSACTSGAIEPSHVLTGIGIEESVAGSSVRISFGKDNTTGQIDYFLDKLVHVLNRMTTAA